MVEYVVILVLVAVPCVLALVALGPVLARLYLVQRAVLLLPMPL